MTARDDAIFRAVPAVQALMINGRADPATVAAAVVDAVTPLTAAQTLRDVADEFAARLPDGTGNGRAYNSYTVAALLRQHADRLEREAGRG